MFRIKWSILALLLVVLFGACGDDPAIETEEELSDYQIQIIDYFQDIALGFENGNNSLITRKWTHPMRVFVDGNPNDEHTQQINKTINEINDLATDGFRIDLVESLDLSNCHLFFGSSSDFSEIYPEASSEIGSNYGTFYVWWRNNEINKARIFVDTARPTITEQRSIIIEEITQSLGLGMDSPKHPNSIFYETSTNGGFATEYSDLDKEVIRLLYHPDMQIGINAARVEELLKSILLSE